MRTADILIRKFAMVGFALTVFTSGMAGNSVDPGMESRRAEHRRAALTSHSRGESKVPNYYIVTVARDAFPEPVRTQRRAFLAFCEELSTRHSGSLVFTYEHAIAGFCAKMPAKMAEVLATVPGVVRVEQDSIMTVNGVQSAPSWGLDRIDQRDRPLDGVFNYAPSSSSVHAYVIDTGINFQHTDFAGRIGNGYSIFSLSPVDDNGHGSHVAGTLAGSTYGIAKNATIHPVKALDSAGLGSTAGIIDAIDWVIANRQLPAVANMSLGGPRDASLDQAVQNLISSGVVVVVAAGNNGADAINYSPAAVSAAITVGNNTQNDTRATTSNFGSVVDLYAPGTDIVSAAGAGSSGSAVKSGTSMAAPHVAGVAATILSENPSLTPAQVAAILVENRVGDRLYNLGTGLDISACHCTAAGFLDTGEG